MRNFVILTWIFGLFAAVFASHCITFYYLKLVITEPKKMEQEEEKVIVAAIVLVLRNLIYSSESDEDDEEVQVIRNPRRNVARTENYVEQAISALNKRAI